VWWCGAVPLIADTEKELNKLLGDFFIGCDLEIEFETPTLEVLLSAPKIFVDDGFRNSVENKGHGLQRAIIFTILRRYADFMTTATEGKNGISYLRLKSQSSICILRPKEQYGQYLEKLLVAGIRYFFSTHSSLLVDVAYFDELSEWKVK